MDSVSSHNNLDALLFYSSAESYALAIQTYRFAKSVLLTNLERATYPAPAVVLDLDETVLDNGAYNAWLIQSGKNFHDDNWNEWCNCCEARLIPGAIDFIEFAIAHGVQVFFITSRHDVTRRATAANLHALGVFDDGELEMNGATDPDPFEVRLFMKGMKDVNLSADQQKLYRQDKFLLKNKFQQRIFLEASRGVEIILSIGDNLGDYAEYYGKVYDNHGLPVPETHPTISSRYESARQDRALFGTDFILMPNSFYGGWLRAFHANRFGAPDEIIYTNCQVRGKLSEPQGSIEDDNGQVLRTEGSKFSLIPKVWSGPVQCNRE